MNSNVPADDIGTLWDAAVMEYNKTAAVEPTLRSYTVDQVLAMTVEKEEYFKRWRNDKGKLDTFRSVLKRCLGPLNALGQFVSANASAVFPPTATICTAVSYIIQTANSVSADYDLLVSFFDELRLFLERLKVIDGHIPNSKDIQRCLVDILVLILKIMGLSVRTMKKGRGLKFLKNLVGEDEELRRNYDQLEKLVKQEESLMLHQVVANTSETLDRLDIMGQRAGDGFSAIKRMEEKTDILLVEMRRLPGGTEEKSKAVHLSIIREYLQPKPVIDDYTRKSSHLLTGSATWLLDEPTFQGWISTVAPQILFISGPPGSGKSHLSTFSIQQLLQHTNSVVAYYYFHDNNLDTRSVFKALSAIVFQIARVDEVYCLRAAAACKQSVRITDATIGSIWEDFFAANYGSSSRCRQLYLVFDGIDEAEGDDIVDLLSLLNACLQRKLKIQVLLVGRPEMDQVVSSLGTDSVAKIEVSIKKNSADIMRYISRTYDQSPALPKRADFRQKVIAALLEGSNGMFLWVDLMLKDLSMRSQPKQILNALKALPKGLDKVYDKILGRIEMVEDDERQSLRELLCWVAHSKKPQTLFVLNLIIRFLTEDELFDVEIVVKKHCASLIILTKTGSALLDEILQTDEGATTSTTYAASSSELGDTTNSPGGASKPVTRDKPRIAQADGGIEDAGDESNEENDLTERIQQNIVVELLHASLGDYLRNPRAQTTALIYSVSEARVRIVISTLQIFCRGGHVDSRLWWFALQNWMTQLRDLDERLVSDSDTKTIVECLVQVFYSSKELQRHIVGTIRNIGLEHFEFGYNDNPQHPFRVTVHRWFYKALQNPSIVLDHATSEWVRKVLENPMRLLVPLTRVCVSEWLQADGETVWLYWRYRLSLTLLLSTDLVPTFKPSEATKAYGLESPEFITGSYIDYVAGFFKADRDQEIHCRVARCMAFNHEFDASISEYRKAAQKLIDSDSGTQSPILQSTLLELATVESYDNITAPKVLDLLNEYLTLDQANYKIYSCLGDALMRCDRLSEANEALAKALTMEPTDPMVSFRLIDTMTNEQRYMDIITLLETEEPRTSCMWILGNIDIPTFHNNVFYAGLVTGNLKLVTEIYKSTIDQISMGTKQASPYGTVYTPESTGVLARRWLALLYQRYAGEPDLAFHLYADALLHNAEFWKLGQWHSDMDREIIPSACNDFAELIYEKSNPLTHGKNDANDPELLTTIKMLERLRARQTASEATTEGHWKIYSQKNINVLLSKLYLRCGRNAEADLLLREQAQRGIDLLQDDLYWNDCYGYQTLSKVLLAYGREDDVRISLSLRQIDFSFQDDTITESGDAGSAPEQTTTATPDLEAAPATSSMDTKENGGPRFIPGVFFCSSGQACQSGGTIASGIGESAQVMWTCTSCINVDFCEECHNALMRSAVPGGDSVGADEKKRPFICSPCHEFLKTPAEDWEGVRDDGVFVMAGKERRIKDWLGDIEAEFKHPGQVSNAYRRQKKDY